MVDTGGGISEESQQGLSPGTRLGKYEIVRLLGAGGMGAVYEAAHTEIGKRVAIKVLSPSIAAVPGARARFLREAQLTSRVRHPNIVDVTDMGSDAGQTYLVMEFLRGEDLAQRLAHSGGFLLPQALVDIMLPVCSAVVEAHKVGITHRDLKPQNIFLAVGPYSTQPKVLDFGISKGAENVGAGALTGTGAMIGTPFYLAPEQIMDTRSAGPNSDQYALGVIMYECLTGRRPYEAENLFVVFQAIVGGNPVRPSQLRPGIPPALEAVVLRAMHLTPGARFPSILALGRALLPFASVKVRSIWEEAFATTGEMSVVDEGGAHHLWRRRREGGAARRVGGAIPDARRDFGASGGSVAHAGGRPARLAGRNADTGWPPRPRHLAVRRIGSPGDAGAIADDQRRPRPTVGCRAAQGQGGGGSGGGHCRGLAGRPGLAAGACTGRGGRCGGDATEDPAADRPAARRAPRPHECGRGGARESGRSHGRGAAGDRGGTGE